MDNINERSTPEQLLLVSIHYNFSSIASLLLNVLATYPVNSLVIYSSDMAHVKIHFCVT